MDFFAVKVHGSDVNPGICLYKSLFSDSWVDVNSINFNSKKVYEDEIFSQQDIYIYIYYNFPQENPKSIIQIFKIPIDH